MSIDQIAAIAKRLKDLGYSTRQAATMRDCWYLSNIGTDALLSLCWENNGWKVRGLNSSGLAAVKAVEAEVDQL